MGIDDLARLEIRNGARLTRVGNRWWRMVRPCFYRPLFPFEEIPSVTPLRYPMASKIGGVQHLVPAGTPANSYMNFLLSDQPQSYSRDALGKTFRYQLRKAESRFAVRPITCASEFAIKGYPVYAEFLNRTGFSYRTDRIRYANFQAWAETLLRFPVLVLGAYRYDQRSSLQGDGLVAISVSYAVEDVVFYATFFAEDTAMRAHVSDLMLNSVRESAAALPQAKYFYASMATGGGHDTFYLLRGLKLQKRPSVLRANGVSLFLLRNFAANRYSRLLGTDIIVTSPLSTGRVA